MYCYIKYLDFSQCNTIPEVSEVSSYVTNQSVNSTSKTTSTTSNKTSLLQNSTLIINPDCFVKILLDYVSAEVGLDAISNYDFCDEQGQLIEIKSLHDCDYATQLLKPLQTYFIVMYEQNELKQFTKLEPLLSKCSKQFTELSLKLSRHISVKDLDRKSLTQSSSKNSSVVLSTSSMQRRNSSASKVKKKKLKKKESVGTNVNMLDF